MKKVTFTHPLLDDLIITEAEAEKLELLESRMPSGWVRKSTDESDNDDSKEEDSNNLTLNDAARNSGDKGDSKGKPNGKQKRNPKSKKSGG